ncbi:MAG: cysteine desulfurase [Bacteroidales bacterium]|nr:cysteine desulfurase [Bacteroidales bacterium]
MAFDIDKIRLEFPVLKRQIHGKPLVYFDNAATTQKPQAVIDRITAYYTNENCNIHRGVHYLSQVATAAFEDTRKHIARFIHAPRAEEVVFTKGTTESINLVAASFGRMRVNEGDEILITGMEHHSNLVPWQMLCYERKAKLKVVPFSDKGEIDLNTFEDMLNGKTRLAAFAHVSNSLGTINPVKEMTELAHKKDIPVLIDGAQAVSHINVDISDLDCDFYAFSGHKAYGPMGVGVLYGKEEHLKMMDPYQSGGEMVDMVTLYETSFNEIPFKFEAGTPNVEAVLGFDAAISFLEETGLEEIVKHEHKLLAYATRKLNKIDGIRFYGTAKNKTGMLSFIIDGIHPYDAGTIMDKFGIAVRTGHHCAQPVMNRFGITGTIRASFAMYNTRQEIDLMLDSLQQVIRMFK